jgi:hypothetical protein
MTASLQAKPEGLILVQCLKASYYWCVRMSDDAGKTAYVSITCIRIRQHSTRIRQHTLSLQAKPEGLILVQCLKASYYWCVRIVVACFKARATMRMLADADVCVC